MVATLLIRAHFPLKESSLKKHISPRRVAKRRADYPAVEASLTV